MKKVKTLLILLIVGLQVSAQFYPDYRLLNDKYLRIAENQVSSDPISNFKDVEINALNRVVEFDLQFRDGTKNFNPKCNTCWNKVVTLATSQGIASKNSLRVGWRYNDSQDKIELGYYSHMNHIDAIASIREEVTGREFTSLNLFVDTWDVVHVELAISKYFFFLRIEDKSITVHRDVFSWSSSGENTLLHINAYFGDKGDNPLSNNDDLPAPEEMTFRVSNIIVDRLSFWTEKKWSKSPYLSFMNTLFYDNDNIVYEASKQISTSIDSETPFSVGRGMPEEYDYGSKPYTFTVFNDGANIKMYSPEIIINPGTIALKGSNVEFVATNEDDYNCGLQFNSVSNAFIYAADENDALVVHAFNVNNYELKVKDRNNRTIWESSGLAYDGINRIWRGQGIVEYGVYIYHLILKNDCGDFYQMVGDVTVLSQSVLKSEVVNQDTSQVITSLNEYEVLNEKDLRLNFEVYPNPISNLLNLNVSSKSNYRIEIYNSMGQVLYLSDFFNTKDVSLDFSQYAKGQYYCVVINKNNERLQKKIIKR